MQIFFVYLFKIVLFFLYKVSFFCTEFFLKVNNADFTLLVEMERGAFLQVEKACFNFMCLLFRKNIVPLYPNEFKKTSPWKLLLIE